MVGISVTPKTYLKRPVTGANPVTGAEPCQLNPGGYRPKPGRVLLPAVTTSMRVSADEKRKLRKCWGDRDV